MRHCALRTAAAGLVFIGALNGARADVIIQTAGLAFSGSHVMSDLVAFEPFELNLGVLNEAVFTTTLMLTYVAETVPVRDADGLLVPTVVTGGVDLGIDGLTWAFDFDADCEQFAILTSGETAFFQVMVNLTWRSDAVSDQLGITIGDGHTGTCLHSVINPVNRSDYIANPFNRQTGLITLFHSTWGVEAAHTMAASTGSGGGIAMLTYDYTPRVAGPVTEPSPVSEPAHGALFGLSLACLALCRRKRGNGVKALPAKQSRAA